MPTNWLIAFFQQDKTNLISFLENRISHGSKVGARAKVISERRNSEIESQKEKQNQDSVGGHIRNNRKEEIEPFVTDSTDLLSVGICHTTGYFSGQKVAKWFRGAGN